jgi:hypothetical protein
MLPEQYMRLSPAGPGSESRPGRHLFLPKVDFSIKRNHNIFLISF